MHTPARGKILGVDDDDAGLELLESILAGDFDLRLVTNGTEALATAKEYRPDLVLLDVILPDFDGYEACRRLRADPNLRHTKVMLISGMSLTADRLRGYDVGADDFITKPYIPSELAAKVRVMLRLKHTEELSRLKDDILTLIAHETRTPLTVINGAVDALMSMELSDVNIGSFLSMISDASARLGALMERSHLLCALKSGSVTPEYKRVNIRTFMGSIVDALADKAYARDVRLAVECEQCAMESDVDEALLRLAVSSVVENAIQFSPEGDTVRLGVTADGGTLVISVIDEGPGFDAEVASHLFEELTTHGILHHSEGARLGLAITREIVRLHAGSIGIEAQSGSGCAVSIRIPCAPSSIEDPAPCHPRSGG